MSGFDSYPFGDPDGSHGDFKEANSSFIKFDDPQKWGGLETNENDRRTRVIVGRKGSGKTIYIRRLRASVADSEELSAGDLEQDPPSSEEIIEFAKKFEPVKLLEYWEKAWRRAIFSAIAKKLGKEFEDTNFDFGLNNGTSRVYRQLSRIILKNESRNSVVKYLNNPKWENLEERVVNTVLHDKPLFIYLDNIDKYFEHAPDYWLSCQIGLLNAVIELTRNNQFGGRIHVITTMRDVVYINALETEHKTRILGNPYIKILDWNWQAIEYLLSQKIKNLDSRYFLASSGGEKTIENWIGLEKISNKRRKTKESPVQYILRHTRLLPRDVIIVCNKISRGIGRLKNIKKFSKAKLNDMICRAVHEAAREICKEQLRITSIQIAAKAGYRPDSPDIDYKEYTKGICDWIKKINRDRFIRSVFLDFCENGSKDFGDHVKPIQCLWMNGLIGYSKREQDNFECAVFYSELGESDSDIPADKRKYVFHSIVIDYVGIKSAGKPVIQCNGE